jgi:hypothetical protein
MGNRESGLRGVFAQALVSVLAASGLAGCGGDDGVPPGIEDDPGFVPVECRGDSQQWLPGLNPAVPTEYMEFRHGTFARSFVAETLGTLCAGASDFAACEQRFAALRSDQTFGSEGCIQICLGAQIAATQGDGAELVDSSFELTSFLTPIDTPTEAMLVVEAATRSSIACHRGGAKPEGDGFVVQGFTYDGCGGRTRHLTQVDAAGNTTPVDSVVESKAKSDCVVGRRPLGLMPARACASPSALGTYLADAARLEAASIAAFRRLRRELRLHGAPQRLLDAAQRAARDEVRHARVVGSLASARGATKQAVRIEPLPLRDLEAIAIENAAEGCVRETYGALVGLWQARFARDARVRAAYAKIAEDEQRHATLAWRVAAWSERRLSAAARVRVRAARAAAVDELFRELAVEPDRDVAVGAGVPGATQALALAEQLRRSIWS